MKYYFLFRLTVVVLLVSLGRADAQPNVPFMWVPKANSQAAEKKFGKGGYPNKSSLSKAAIFNAAIGGGTHPVSYTYPAGSIDQLITLVQADDKANGGTGIRVYFAAYRKSNPPTGFSMGNTKDKQVILIFCGSKGKKSPDVGSYYVFSPDDNLPHAITSAMQADWVKYYQQSEDNIAGLVSTLEAGQSENYDGTRYSDTESIYYDMDNFVEFLQTERQYQDTNTTANPTGIKIDAIVIYFSDYSNAGIEDNPYGEPDSEYKDRLFVLYEFMRGGQPFYIDDVPGFCNRSGSDCGQVSLLSSKRGGDNGQLCPPNCP